MNAKITLDTREFDEAMRLYADATGKDAYDVVLRASRNVTGRAIQFTDKANKQDIRGLESKPWWWKMVSQRLKSKGQPATPANKNALSKKIIAARARSSGFIASGWLKAFNAIKDLGGSVGRSSVKQYGRAKGDVSLPVLDANPTCEFINMAFGTKSKTSSQTMPTIAFPALQKAVNLVADDMSTYAFKRMDSTARKFSAK